MTDNKEGTSNRDPITNATRRGHKLLFSTYTDADDLLPWLNRCDQFFHIQNTEDTDKVFLANFYMDRDAAQWYALVERNYNTPSWLEFV
jgi:hypothetical protein